MSIHIGKLQGSKSFNEVMSLDSSQAFDAFNSKEAMLNSKPTVQETAEEDGTTVADDTAEEDGSTGIVDDSSDDSDDKGKTIPPMPTEKWTSTVILGVAIAARIDDGGTISVKFGDDNEIMTCDAQRLLFQIFSNAIAESVNLATEPETTSEPALSGVRFGPSPHGSDTARVGFDKTGMSEETVRAQKIIDSATKKIVVTSTLLRGVKCVFIVIFGMFVIYLFASWYQAAKLGGFADFGMQLTKEYLMFLRPSSSLVSQLCTNASSSTTASRNGLVSGAAKTVAGEKGRSFAETALAYSEGPKKHMLLQMLKADGFDMLKGMTADAKLCNIAMRNRDLCLQREASYLTGAVVLGSIGIMKLAYSGSLAFFPVVDSLTNSAFDWVNQKTPKIFSDAMESKTTKLIRKAQKEVSIYQRRNNLSYDETTFVDFYRERTGGMTEMEHAFFVDASKVFDAMRAAIEEDDLAREKEASTNLLYQPPDDSST